MLYIKGYLSYYRGYKGVEILQLIYMEEAWSYIKQTKNMYTNVGAMPEMSWFGMIRTCVVPPSWPTFTSIR